MLILMSGLPGVGKSAIADHLGRRLPACVVSVDAIEAAVVRSGIEQSFETGVAAYEVGAAVAAHQLSLGFTVVADAANYLEVGRDVWRRVAREAGVPVRVLHIVCSDEAEHRHRLATRERGRGYRDPSWSDVQRVADEFEPWPESTLMVDSVKPLDESVDRCLAYVIG